MPSVNVFEAVVAHVHALLAQRKKVVIALWSEGSRDRMASMLADHKLANITSVNTWRTVQATPRNETMLAVLGMESRLRDRRRRRHQRAGHSGRPPGAAAQGEPQARQFHLGGHEPVVGRHRRPCRARHRPLRRPADPGGRRRAARLPRTALCRRNKTVPAGREHRTAVALRLRPDQCRTRPARRQRLAGAQGEAEEPHPRDRGRTDQDRRRTHAARGAEIPGAAACL